MLDRINRETCGHLALTLSRERSRYTFEVLTRVLPPMVAGPLLTVALEVAVMVLLGWKIDWTSPILLTPPLVVLYGTEILLLLLLKKRLGPFFAVLRIARTIWLLEKDVDKWGDWRFMRRVIHRLEGIASMVERVPGALQIRDKLMCEQMTSALAGRALEIRRLKAWVVSPGPFTYTDLLDRLDVALRVVLDGRWLDLPGTDVLVVSPTWKRTVSTIALAVLFLIALVGVQYWASLFGSGAAVISTLLGAVLVAILGKLGVSGNDISTASALAGKAKGAPGGK